MDFSLRHVGVVSRDLEYSKEFWEQAFDYEVFWDEVEPSPYISQLLGFPCEGLRTVKMSAPSGHVIELLSFPDSGQTASDSSGKRLVLEGISHMAINVKDIHQSLEKLKSLGAKVVSNGVQIPPGSSMRVAYVLAPGSVYLELVES